MYGQGTGRDGAACTRLDRERSWSGWHIVGEGRMTSDLGRGHLTLRARWVRQSISHSWRNCWAARPMAAGLGLFGGDRPPCRSKVVGVLCGYVPASTRQHPKRQQSLSCPSPQIHGAKYLCTRTRQAFWRGAELGLASNHGPGRACVPLTVWWVWWCGSLCHRRETEPDRGWLAAQGDQQAADDASVVCGRSVSDCASEALQTGGTGGGWLQCAAHCRL